MKSSVCNVSYCDLKGKGPTIDTYSYRRNFGKQLPRQERTLYFGCSEATLFACWIVAPVLQIPEASFASCPTVFRPVLSPS